MIESLGVEDPFLLVQREEPSLEPQAVDSSTGITVEHCRDFPVAGVSFFAIWSAGYSYDGPNVGFKRVESGELEAIDRESSMVREVRTSVGEFVDFMELNRVIRYVGISATDPPRVLVATELKVVDTSEKLVEGEAPIELTPRDVMDIICSKEDGFMLLPPETKEQHKTRRDLELSRQRFLERYEDTKRSRILPPEPVATTPQTPSPKTTPKTPRAKRVAKPNLSPKPKVEKPTTPSAPPSLDEGIPAEDQAKIDAWIASDFTAGVS